MSKLAHSNQETMDELDRQCAIEDGNEDLLLGAAQRAVMKYPYFTEREALEIAKAAVAAARAAEYERKHGEGINGAVGEQSKP